MEKIVFKAALAYMLVSTTLITAAQGGNELGETVWGTVVYTTVGDSSPEVWKDRSLSPFGAQQLHDAGTAVASRYVRPSSDDSNNTVIAGISPSDLVNSQLKIIAKDDVPSVSSAMAFMQGLYPIRANENRTGLDAKAHFPYAGYQYPQIKTADGNNPLLMQVAGHEGCPSYTRAMNTYSGTEEFVNTMNRTQHFYKELGRHELRKAFAEGTVSYASASPVWDYLRYQWPRSSALQTSMSQAELIEARQLANQFEWAINTLVTTDNKVGDKDVKAIHGKSLARAITKAIRDNMDYKGVRNKMTLLFGDHRPMMAFASLSKLASRRHPTFYTLPNGGASFIFELFSYPENTTNSTGATEKYPKSNFLNVRFYMRNDTSSSEANFKAYPLFENSPSKISMPLPEFLQSMDGISVQPAEWCELCDSKKAWCASATAKGEGSASRIGHEDDYQKYDDDEYNPWACGDKAAHAIRMTSFRMGVAVVVIPVMLVLTVLLWLLAGHILRDEIKHWWVTRSKWSPKRLFRRRGGTQNTPTTPHPDVSRAHVDGGNTRQTRSDDIELQTSYPPLDHINPSCASPTPSSAAPTLANPFASKPPSFV